MDSQPAGTLSDEVASLLSTSAPGSMPHLSFLERLLPRQAKRVARSVRQRAETLGKLSGTELRSLSNQIRQRYVSDTTEQLEKPPEQRQAYLRRTYAVPVLALGYEAIRRELGLHLHDVQLQAAYGMISGAVVEMQTGEGKTLSGFPAALFHAFADQGVHVSTPNQYLAERDCAQLKPAFESLGLSCCILPTTPNDSKTEAYRADVTYGPGYEFGFDYLRDQLQLLSAQEQPLGQSLYNDFLGKPATGSLAMRKQACALVDEADHVLVDDASSPLVLSEATPGIAPDREALLLAKHVAAQLHQHEHFTIAAGTTHFTDLGLKVIHDSSVPIPVQQLVRPWTTYVNNAIAAELCFRKDIEYVLDGDEIKLVDQSTGRIFEDRTWDAGIHQAVEVKEGLDPTPDMIPLAKITRQRFYRRYAQLGGMTGTALGCKPELKKVYGLDVCVIPPRLPSQRQMLPMRSFASSDAKWQAIAASAQDFHRRGRPVLVGTNSIADSLIIAELLRASRTPFHLLNGRQDADEAEVISQAGQTGAITIATNMAGRGTDIKLSTKSRELGGLHVIVSECHFLSRVDRQLVGRCARQGDPGSAQSFLSSEDAIIARYAPWLGNSIRRIVGQSGESSSDLSGQIRKIQQAAETEQFLARLQLLDK